MDAGWDCELDMGGAAYWGRHYVWYMSHEREEGWTEGGKVGAGEGGADALMSAGCIYIECRYLFHLQNIKNILWFALCNNQETFFKFSSCVNKCSSD